DGFQRVHAVAPRVPAILLTGTDDEQLALQAMRDGAQDYLVKGHLDPRSLARSLRYAIERKRAAEALRQSEEFFRLISENVTDLIVVLDREGRRLYNSSSYRNILGEPARLVGTSSFDEIHPDDRTRVRELFFQTVQDGIGRRTDYRLLLRDGTVRHIESQGSVIRDDSGRVSKVVVVSRDITERKLAEETVRAALAELEKSHVELKAAQRQIVQSERLEAVSTFAAGVAHEVKNPLQAIVLGVDYLSHSSLAVDATARMVLQEMDHAVTRADGIIKGLLEFSASSRTHVRELNLNTVIEAALQSVATDLTAAGIILRFHLSADLPAVSLDSRTMKHVFINFFLNAVRTMPNGGHLDLRTECREAAQVPRSFRLKPGDRAVVALIEQKPNPSPAIPGTNPPNGSAVASPTQGAGLGLTVLRKLIELHGGMVECHESSLEGCRFLIFFKAESLSKP
ncbi:MAG TPA: PAS domain S-box protein, partial [Methylomirabilota bacterium]|nr:PAS domain S-box protein [Methylomirabilota bacterium]